MKILFHHPLPLDANLNSASGIRPSLLKQAFEACGCQVDVVAGFSRQRQLAIQRIKASIRSGVTYDFMYSESSTMPTLLTDPHHLPLHPRLDFGFFSFLKRHQVKIGLFYRDIYWMFPDYDQALSRVKASVAKFFYRYDLRQYRHWVDRLYLPSLEMGRYLPTFDSTRLGELPAGHSGKPAIDSSGSSEQNRKPGLLQLLYVGGLARHYQMHELFRAVANHPNLQLTICTRREEWQAIASEYAPLLSDQIKIVHQSGSELQASYAQADLALLFVAPQTYREFAVPFKLFEYLGHHKPIIASAATLAGDFVARNQIGWAIPYQADALKSLLQQLIAEPQTLASVKAKCSQVALSHTWKARAQQVIHDMQELPSPNWGALS